MTTLRHSLRAAHLVTSLLAPALLLALPPKASALPQPTPQDDWSELWVHTSDNNGNWRVTAENSALGYFGTQVMEQVGPFTDYTRVLSSFDSSTPTPVWERTEPDETRNQRVAAAETAPLYATLHSRPTDDPFGRRDAVLRTYHPTSSAPQSEYSLPVETNGHEKLFLETARDGSLVVAVIYDAFAFQQNLPDTFIALLDPATGGIQFDRIDLSFAGFNHAALSADGQRLLLSTGSQFVVYDTTTQQTVHTENHPFGFQPAGCAISGDGNTLCHFGSQVNNGVLEASQRIYMASDLPGTPAYGFDQEILQPSASRASVAALSDDGLELVSGLDFPSYTRVLLQGHRIQASTRNVQGTFGRNFFSTSDHQLYASAVDLSEEGETAVFGLSGDAGGAEPELVIFETNSSIPLASFDVRGSVYSVDLVNDFLLVANKSVHFSEFAGGGDFRLFTAPRDLTLGGGKPAPGVTLTAETRGGLPTSFSRIIFADSLGIAPWSIGLIGTLYPDRQDLKSRPVGNVDTNGFATGSFTLGDQVGEVIYAQGLHTGPARRLTKTWLPVMTLPQ